MTSSSIVRTSRAGSTEPAACGTDGIAEHADDVEQRVGVAERRDVEQGGGAASSPPAAPPMSANSTVAGVCFFGLEERGERSRRSSGTRETPDVRVLLPGRPGSLAGARQQLEQGGLARTREIQ